MNARDICDRWVARIGHGFHPDTRACEYDPPLPPAWREEYDRDMDALLAVGVVRYAAAIAAYADWYAARQGWPSPGARPAPSGRRLH